MSFSPDLKRFWYFFFFLFGTVPFYPFSFHDIRKSRVVCNRKTVEKGKGQKKFTYTPSTSKFRRYFSYLKKNVFTHFIFLLSSFRCVILQENKPRLGFGLFLSMILSSLFFPIFIAARQSNAVKIPGNAGGELKNFDDTI